MIRSRGRKGCGIGNVTRLAFHRLSCQRAAAFAVSTGLQHHQIGRCSLWNCREGNPGLERDESSCTFNSKGEEVYVRKLSWAMNPGRVNNLLIQQADFIGPEFMYVRFTSVGKALHDCLDR